MAITQILIKYAHPYIYKYKTRVLTVGYQHLAQRPWWCVGILPIPTYPGGSLGVPSIF